MLGAAAAVQGPATESSDKAINISTIHHQAKSCNLRCGIRWLEGIAGLATLPPQVKAAQPTVFCFNWSQAMRRSRNNLVMFHI